MDPNNPIKITRKPMKIHFSDALFDYYECEFDPGVTRLCYYFELQKQSETIFYHNDGFFKTPHENRQLYYNFHYIRIEDMPHVPQWFKKAVVYQIYPDSFATSREFISGEGKCILKDGQKFEAQNGGTIAGIRENIGYLKELGINCIYMTPIFAANSWHKYDSVDYFEIDPCFGTKEDFRQLVDDCHRNGIRVILDGVFNHCGPGFFAFRDLMKNGPASKYLDWFYVKDFPVQTEPRPNYECFAYVSTMPKLNTGNPEVKKYLLDVGTYWIREFDIDGWRLDVANEIDHDFWRDYRRAIRSVKEDAVLIGEIWDDSRSFLEGDQFDSVMNYNLTFAVIDAVAKREMNAREFADRVSYLMMRYQEPMQQAQLNLIDSHDIPRFITQAGGDRERLKLAALFLLTHVGAPMIFYGDEQGLAGWHEIEYRRPMEWKQKDQEMYSFYRKAIGLRKCYMNEILKGYRILYSDDAIFTYCCEDCGRGFLVAMNLSDKMQHMVFNVPENMRQILDSPIDYFTSQCYQEDGTNLLADLQPGSAIVVPIGK